MSAHTAQVGVAALLTGALVLACSDADTAEHERLRPVVPALSFDTFVAPPAEDRPWVRWFWPGNDVDADQLRDDVDYLADRFFGGAEIGVENSGLNPDSAPEVIARRLSFDSPEFYANVRAALEQADKRGIRLDLTLGSGWPLASARYTPQQSTQSVLWGEWCVHGRDPDCLNGSSEVVIAPLEPKKTGMYHLADAAVSTWPLLRWMPEHATLVQVLAARVTGGSRGASGLDVTDTLGLDRDSVVSLDDRVDADGALRWTPPDDGEWRVIAFFQGPDGEYAVDVAESGANDGAFPGQHGAGIFVADHFDADLVRSELEHLLGERTGFEPFHGGALRQIFTDSFEFKTDRFLPGDFFEEFEQRRGYDVRPWLPVVLVPGIDSFAPESLTMAVKPEFAFGSDDARVRYDYQLTISDLFIERYVANVTGWLDRRGLEFRIQPYGVNLDVIRAAGAAHQPETEAIWGGGSEMFYRLVASGAHLYGRAKTSIEIYVSGRGWGTTPAEMRIAADKAFGAGVNELVYHGFATAYGGQGGTEYGATGWSPYNSRYPRRGSRGPAGGENFGPTFPFQEDLPAVNLAISRGQHLLRQGAPEADLLVYYPWFNFPNSVGFDDEHDEYMLFHHLPGVMDVNVAPPAFDLISQFFEITVDERVDWLKRLWKVVQPLEAHGFSWDFVNDAKLATARASESTISIDDLTYSGLVIFDSEAMQPDAAEAVARLASMGVPVIGIGALPSQQPGFFEQATGDRRVASAMDAIEGSDRFVASREGSIVDDAAAIRLRPVVAIEDRSDGLRAAHRRLENGAIVAHVRNVRNATERARITFADACHGAYFLDPWTGLAALAAPDANQLPTNGFDVALEWYESVFIVCGDGTAPAAARDEPAWGRRVHDPDEEIALTKWTLDVEAGDGSRVRRKVFTIGDFSDDAELRWVRGPAAYSTNVNIDAIAAGARVELDLGWVHGVAAVRVNGTDAGRLSTSPFRIDVTDWVNEGKNAIELVVSLPMHNYLIGLGAGGDPEYDQWSGREGAEIPSGVLGPARLLIGTPGS